MGYYLLGALELKWLADHTSTNKRQSPLSTLGIPFYHLGRHLLFCVEIGLSFDICHNLMFVGDGQWPSGKKVHIVDRVKEDPLHSQRKERQTEALFQCSAVIVTLKSLSSILMTSLSSQSTTTISSSHYYYPLSLISIIESYLPPIAEWHDNGQILITNLDPPMDAGYVKNVLLGDLGNNVINKVAVPFDKAGRSLRRAHVILCNQVTARRVVEEYYGAIIDGFSMIVELDYREFVLTRLTHCI
jgi:hypothetical protein